MTFSTCCEEFVFDWQRSLMALVILVPCVELGSSTVLPAAGDLSGPGQIMQLPREDRTRAVAIQADGTILVAGSTDLFGSLDFQVMRFAGQ